MTDPTTDRATLAGDAYADERNLAARQGLYSWQAPRYDLPSLTAEALANTTGHVIDVGCGNGKFLRHLAASRADLDLVGVDISLGIMKGINLPVVVADAQRLPFRDQSAAAVLAMHMLYHVEDIDLGLRELRRILQPGGMVVVSTNSATDKAELDELWSRACGDVLGRPYGPRRVSLSARFTLEAAPRLLADHFEVLETINLPGVISVDDPEPVVAHCASYRAWADQQDVPFDAVLVRVRQRLRDHIAANGRFEISCLGGIVVGRRPR